MSECQWLHEQLEGNLPLVAFPFELEQIPKTGGVYFFYEKGESCGHGSDRPRIVRVGISGSVRQRIGHHFADESKGSNCRMYLEFPDKPAYVRSSFRRDIGKVLLSQRKDDEFLDGWSKGYDKKAEWLQLRGRVWISKDKKLQQEITKIMREKFTFRFICVDEKADRDKIEKRCTGTVAQCVLCQPSERWLGLQHPNPKTKRPKISEGKLWQVNNRSEKGIDDGTKTKVLKAITDTKKWLGSRSQLRIPISQH